MKGVLSTLYLTFAGSDSAAKAKKIGQRRAKAISEARRIRRY